MPLDPSIPYADLTYRIIGAAMRVHNRLGPGLKEQHYQRGLTMEMQTDGLLVEEEYAVDIYDGDTWLGRMYLDHWVENKVVVEIKALSHLLTNLEVAQVISYLAATQAPVGLLINFGRKRLEYKRILPPKTLTDWKTHIQKFLWKPPTEK
ncbi:MAG: GxxExxY protein [Chloroflexota bacterium]